MKATGGFVISSQDLVRHSYHHHTAALDFPASQSDLDALNRVGATPHRINGYILGVLEEALEQKIPLPGLEEATMRCPEGWSDYATWKAHLRAGGKTLQDAVWEAMDKPGRQDFLSGIAEIHKHNAGAEGRLWAVKDLVSIARALRSEPRIWFPHSRDFRGRIYPMVTSGPNPQGSDMSKSLLQFANGLPLGREGVHWLMVRAAGEAGQDKLSFDARAAWTAEHCIEIMDAAEDPLHDTFWQGVDNPWGFLATCDELRRMWMLDDTAQFVSHLPVPLDGSCNGLQHLGAMSLDEDVCRATNLTENPERQDLYSEVAAIVAAAVERDAADGLAEAQQWYGKVTRAVVKRSVMTTPYGVTERGIRTQLINDGLLEEFNKSVRGTAADYIRDRIVEALDTKIGKARGIMAWLRTVARRLSDAGQPFKWTTPSGSTVLQAYKATSQERVRTLVGQAVIYAENPNGGFNGPKQSQGSAPNYIHSFDAAHLCLVVNAAWEDGMRSFSLVHDSYGTHARNTGDLARVLRETFVEMYRTDWLAQLASAIRSDPETRHVEIPDPPARGNFDITRALNAPFIFS